MFDKGLLAAASVQSPLSKRAQEDDYALGGRVRTPTLDGKARTVAWETGNTAGYRSLCAHRLDTRTTIVILNNTSLAQRVLDAFATAVFLNMH